MMLAGYAQNNELTGLLARVKLNNAETINGKKYEILTKDDISKIAKDNSNNVLQNDNKSDIIVAETETSTDQEINLPNYMRLLKRMCKRVMQTVLLIRQTGYILQ